jgi:methyltransferase-like protein/2-polyprenyl-3-methyl-5-hydroxy-6-metoxy-1,4-benzoquinol methylase
MSDVQPTSYDEVPYDSYPFVQTHPDRLATVATLLGMQPASVAHCRVLELGCASGGNLLPMALTLPESRFVGIDLSRRQIAEGQQVAERLGLKNIELKHLSIMDVTEDFGRFDYLICHGVFSWVSTQVQDKILAICAQNLTPNGVAYVSYNTYPGWHMRGLIRDMMSYHARQFSDSLVRVKQARNLLDFLANAVAKENTPYSLLLKSELESIRQSRDSYLFHEHLEDFNEPIYFHQFAERAAAKGLRYLGEVDLRVMLTGNYPPEVENVLKVLSPDLIHVEQYMDFLRNRMFRQTLLCRQSVVPNYTLYPERLTRFHVASAATPVAASPDIRSTAVEQFRAPDGATVSSGDPLVKAALLHLSEIWPASLPFLILRTMARSRLGEEPNQDAAAVANDTQNLGKCFLTCYTSASNLVELHLHPPQVVTEISARPVASPLARLQATTGNAVTNLRHELVVLAEFERHVVRHLDGTHDRTALVDCLAELVAQGVLQVQEDGQTLDDRERIRRVMEKALEERLPKLARDALLMG